MFFTKGVSIYDLPEWLSTRVVFYEHEMSDGSWIELTLPVVVMILCCIATWFMISRTTIGRQLYAFGDNPEGARRFGINIGAMHYLSFGWLGLMAGIAGLMQAHYAQEVVPNALMAASSMFSPQPFSAVPGLAAARGRSSAACLAFCLFQSLRTVST